MVTGKPMPKGRGIPPKLPNPGMPANPMAQGISLALFSAAQDNCDCRACQVLKKVLADMTEQYLHGGE